MSTMAFPPQRPPLQSVGPRGEITQSTIQKMLDENHQLIMTIVDYQSKGRKFQSTKSAQQYSLNIQAILLYRNDICSMWYECFSFN